MLKNLKKLLNLPRQMIVGVVTIVVLLIASGGLGMLESAELNAYDAWFAVRKPIPADDRFIIVGIDEPSLAQMAATVGRWPWPRSVHAQLLDKLGEAKVVAFDIIWDAKSEIPGDDEALAAAIARNGRVVLTTFAKTDFVKGQQVNTSPRYPVKVLRDAARGSKPKFSGEGVANTPTGDDSVVRANIPVDTDMVGEPYPSLSLAALLAYKGYAPAQVKLEHLGPVTVGDLTIPRDRDGQTLVNYFGPAGSIKTVSYSDVLSGKVPPSTFKDKIVFVGATGYTMKDDFAVPYAKNTQEGQLMPGVEVQANTAATYLRGDSFTRAPKWLNILITLLMGAVVMAFSGRLRMVLGAASTLGLTIAYVVGAYLAWSQAHFWLDVATPAAASLLVYTATTAENYLREEAEKRRVRNLFGRYVSHNVVAELLKNPEMLNMGGRRFSVTILFSDIRGFTSFSESRDPHEVVERINEYCQDMVELIYKHGGTLDKYMGDGIMAYFGAPIPFDDHAERAMTCAYEMREKMMELHARWNAAGKQTFKIGVGLNSGDVIAGNIGHTDRVEYSLIGSAVNLAARLESMTKEYAKSDYGGIVFSVNTYKMAPKAVERYSPHDIGEVEVRGMVQPQHIYTM